MEDRNAIRNLLASIPYEMHQDPEMARQYFQKQLMWAKTYMKKSDRIMWWLKLQAIHYYYTQTHGS